MSSTVVAASVPFKDELVDVTHTRKAPEYLGCCHIDWSCIFNSETSESNETDGHLLSSLPKQEGGSPLVEFEELVKQKAPTTLDETQLSAIKTALENRVTLIQVRNIVDQSI